MQCVWVLTAGGPVHAPQCGRHGSSRVRLDVSEAAGEGGQPAERGTPEFSAEGNREILCTCQGNQRNSVLPQTHKGVASHQARGAVHRWHRRGHARGVPDGPREALDGRGVSGGACPWRSLTGPPLHAPILRPCT